MSANPIQCLAAALLIAATPALAADRFDGTWKGDVASATVTGKPDTLLLKNGTYTCSSCTPAYTIKADGAFHAVKGKSYWDETSVAIVDDHTVTHQYRKGGKVIGTGTDSVSADGRTLTMKSMNTNNAAGVPVEATASETRLAAAPAGAHAISGSWKTGAATSVSDTGVTMTLSVVGNTLNLTSPMGETLAATFGGPYAPNVGDPGKTMTKVERIGADAIRMTDMRLGKVVGISTYTLDAAGKVMTGSWRDPSTGQSGTFKAYKQ